MTWYYFLDMNGRRIVKATTSTYQVANYGGGFSNLRRISENEANTWLDPSHGYDLVIVGGNVINAYTEEQPKPTLFHTGIIEQNTVASTTPLQETTQQQGVMPDIARIILPIAFIGAIWYITR